MPVLTRALIFLFVVSCSAPQTPGRLTAQPERPAQGLDEEVADLFTRPFPEGELPTSPAFSPDGRQLAYFRTSGEGDLVSRAPWVMELAERRARPLFAQGQSLPVEAFEWFPDSLRLLALAGGNLYVVPLDGGPPAQLTSEPLQSPQLSSDGRQVAFVRDHDLWLLDLETRQERRLTSDGAEDRLNGEVDWVYQEELELYSGFWFSPDGRRLAYVQFDESPVTAYPLLYPTAQTPELVSQRYPQAGEDNPIVRLGVIDLEQEVAETRWLDHSSGTGEELYLARVGWSPAGDRLVTITLDRLQRVLRLSFVDPQGQTPPRLLLEERDEQWLNLLDLPRFLAEGQRFLWRSERDGHAHLYIHDLDGGTPRQLTRGPWEVASVSDVDEAAGLLRFVANREDPSVFQLYSLPLEGEALPTQVSTQRGCHEVSFSPDHRHYLDVHSSLARPPRAELFDAAGRSVATVAAEDLRSIEGLDEVRVDLFDLPGPGDLSYKARLFRPSQLEPARRYPVVVWVYNGPAAQIVRDEWRTKYVPWMRLLASRGVLVFSMDGRGTSGRGRDWERPIYRQLTEVELEDQLRGVEHLRGLDFVDGDRIGIFGWSYGGTMVLASLLRHPGTFRVGVSVAPVTDWRFYDTIYSERYMMRPQDNPDGYQRAALWSLASQLRDPLLLIHGLSDDNVHFRNSERMIEALIDEGRQFDLMVYPGQAHGIAAPTARRHVFSQITTYLLQHLR